MAVADSYACDQSFGCLKVSNGEDSTCEGEHDDRNQVTPQYVLDSLSHYIIRQNGAHLRSDTFCGICYCKYHVGDKIICLPCQHNFHDHCIENWLKWVKSTCPIDKKSVIRRKYMDEVVNERKNHLLGVHQGVNIEVCSTEEGKTSPVKGIINLHSDSPKKVSENNYECRKVNDDKTLKICKPNPKTQSPAGCVQISESATDDYSSLPEEPKTPWRSDDFERSEKWLQNSKASFSNKYPQELRDSVNVIRKSIKSERQKTKKIENLDKFDSALDKTIEKLDNVKIYYPKERSGGNLKTENVKPIARSLSPSKCTKTEDVSHRGLMNKRNVTFREMAEMENQAKSGWIYTRSRQVIFARYINPKTHLSEKKKIN